MSESITKTGTTMESYYGRPIVKEPVWKPEIPTYLWTGGIAGGCGVLHGLARVTGNQRLAKSALYVGAAAEMVSPLLLVSDLGRPERFLNMLRVFKVTSPMSVGSWILFASSGATNTAAALELLGILRPVKWLAEVVSCACGPPRATNTRGRRANNPNPGWCEARDELPWLFGSSAAASAGAALAICTPTHSAGPARRTAIAAGVAELALMKGMERKLGFVGEVYKQGEAHAYGKKAELCTAAGAALLAAGGKRSRAVAAAGGALMLAGSLAMRWSVFKAGFQSARDPRYTVIPQKKRKEARDGK
jgi:hypothetical protein